MEELSAGSVWDDSVVSIALRDREQELEETVVQIRHTLIALGYHEDNVDSFIKV